MRTEFIKFQSEDLIGSFLHGTVYMKELKYFVDLEKQECNEIVGDEYENAIKSTAYQTPYGMPLNLSIKNESCKSYVFCMYKANIREDGTVYLKNEESIKEFGASGLWIKNMREFIKRIEKAATINNYTVLMEDVFYYDDSENITPEVMNSFVEKQTIAFCKRRKYNYQNEYRFVINSTIGELSTDDHIILNIGDISDITQKVKLQELIDGTKLI